jgi:type II secretory pathway component PulF
MGWKAYEQPSMKKLRLVKAVAPSVLLETGSTFNQAFESWATQTAREALAILHTAHEDINKGQCLADSIPPTEETV